MKKVKAVFEINEAKALQQLMQAQLASYQNLKKQGIEISDEVIEVLKKAEFNLNTGIDEFRQG